MEFARSFARSLPEPDRHADSDGPFLAVAIVLGLVLGLVQAVTQIQDQTVPQLVKIVGLFMMVLGFSTWLSIPLYEHTLHLFTMFPYLVR